MTPQEKAKFLYTQKAGLYQRIFIDILHYPKGIELFFKEYFSTNNYKGSILDAGTGTGVLIKALYNTLPKSQFEKIHFDAFDISDKMLFVYKAWIEENHIKNIEIFEADVLKLDQIKQTSYDFILSAGMLEYVAKDEFTTALTMLRKRLKKDGKHLLFISKKTLFNVFLIKLWWKANLYSKDELLAAIKEAGFQNITFYTFPRSYHYLSWSLYIIEASI